ncbi:MAG TPA: hypothetical protein VEJ40_03005 [Pseudolabrys sp.]|nr:hypothetical protein [Pseudolabrys sp.]
MRKLSTAAVAMIMAIALYFTLFWGFDALRMLTSPTYGLEDVWRSQFVFEIGRLFGLTPIGLIKLAAFFATLKLGVAIICALHIADRMKAIAGGQANGEILEGGLMLVMFITFASIGPAIWSHNAELVREQLITLLLVGVATGLGMLERSYQRADKSLIARTSLIADNAVAPRDAQWFSPLR